jgi:hypothetical protein
MRPGESPDDDARRQERRTKAMQLRRSGKSYREIGAALGVHPSTAEDDVKACFRESRREATAEAKELELTRYDQYLERADASIIGHVGICEECGRSDLKAIETAMRISKARRELLGLDAPTKTQEVPAEPVDEDKLWAKIDELRKHRDERKDGMH